MWNYKTVSGIHSFLVTDTQRGTTIDTQRGTAIATIIIPRPQMGNRCWGATTFLGAGGEFAARLSVERADSLQYKFAVNEHKLIKPIKMGFFLSPAFSCVTVGSSLCLRWIRQSLTCVLGSLEGPNSSSAGSDFLCVPEFPFFPYEVLASTFPKSPCG